MFRDNGNTIMPVIGLEIHVQLKTQTKLFCHCPNRFGDPPNTNVCPVCLGLPGALPVLNRAAVELAIKAGLALDCTVSGLTKWDRKSYYYPDLPKNYQISQYDKPISENGFLEVPDRDNNPKRIGILRAHLEEDAGKNIHDHLYHTGVDLNRAGVPLLEIVSQPQLNSASEVLFYAKNIQRIMRWLHISDANMEKGQIRFEPNINLHITSNGTTYKTPIVEVKNLNSFKSLELCVAFEMARQYEEWQRNQEGFTLARLGKQNRGFDMESGQTVFQRDKEEAHEYRYFPEPDLVPVVIDQAWIERIRSALGELPLAREKRFNNQYNLNGRDLAGLTQDKKIGDTLDQAIAAGGEVKKCANLLLGKAAQVANSRGKTLADLKLDPIHLAELTQMLVSNQISSTSGDLILERILSDPLETRGPLAIAGAEGLLAETDFSQIAAWVEEALKANPKAREDVLSHGKNEQKALGFLTGQVMQSSKGKAPPREVSRILRQKLGLE